MPLWFGCFWEVTLAPCDECSINPSHTASQLSGTADLEATEEMKATEPLYHEPKI